MSEQTSAAVALTVNAHGFVKGTFPLNKTVDKKYKKIGDVPFYVPTLAAFGLDAEVESISEEDGLPVYKDERFDWLFGAVVDKVRTKVKGLLADGSILPKEGASIPEDFVALLAEGKRGAGQYLATVAKLKAAFASYMAGLGKSAAAQKMVCEAFANPKGVAMAADAMKIKFLPYFEGFMETSEETELLEAGSKYLQSLLDACVPAPAEEDAIPADF